jgi:hypothetical protein
MDTELTVKSGGREWPVEIGGDGTFVATIDGNRVNAPSLKELERKAAKVKVKFELPFTRVEGSRIQHGTVTGIHASSRNLLVRWEPEIIAGRPAAPKTDQVPGWSGHTVMPRLDDADAHTLKFLLSERDKAVRELDNFLKPRVWRSFKEAAEKAQADAVAKEAAGNEG